MFRAQTEAAKIVEELQEDEAEHQAILENMQAQVVSVREQAQARERQQLADREERLASLKEEARIRHQGRISKGLAYCDYQENLEYRTMLDREEAGQGIARIQAEIVSRLEQDIQRLSAELNTTRAEAVRAAEGDKAEDAFAIAGDDGPASLGDPVPPLSGPKEALPILGASSVSDIHAMLGDRRVARPELREERPIFGAAPCGPRFSPPDFRVASADSWARIHGRFSMPLHGDAPKVVVARGDFRMLPAAFWTRLHGRFAAERRASSAAIPSTPQEAAARAMAAAKAGAAQSSTTGATQPLIALSPSAVAGAPLACPPPVAPPVTAAPPRVRPCAPDFRTAPAAYWAVVHARFERRLPPTDAPGPALGAGASAASSPSSSTPLDSRVRLSGLVTVPSSAASMDGYPEQPFELLPSVGPALVPARARRVRNAAINVAAVEAKNKTMDAEQVGVDGTQFGVEVAMTPAVADADGDTRGPDK